tara:strand:- start:175 stop:507 length:333 start_codon:yes stop_codon:yes gene_type:complete
MKTLGFLLSFIFITSCFHEEIYSCSAPKQTDIFIEIKNKKFYFKYSGKPKFETYPILINNKMEIVAVQKFKYSASAFTYKLNKIENKLNVKYRNKQGRVRNNWNFKCTKK